MFVLSLYIGMFECMCIRIYECLSIYLEYINEGILMN